MRFTGQREVEAGIKNVWSGLHDDDVLRRAIPGCQALEPRAPGRYAATLAARVGPVADTYRGRFSIHDTRPGTQLHVRISGRGRCGHLEVDLRVSLAELHPGTTLLRYDAVATVSGLVARLGNAAMTAAGGHLTGCFFRDLERALRRHPARVASYASAP